MKTFFIIPIILFLIILLGCSSKDTNEIDRLAEKYKGITTYELPSGHGKIMSEVVLLYNTDSLPWRITLQGNTENPEGLSEIFSNLALEKMKNGYRPEDSTNFSSAYIKDKLGYFFRVFKKDTLVFALYSAMKLDTLYEERIIKMSYNFAITNADESRKIGNNSKIDF